jgi:uncharacterized surface protein with fasciclin (FAS1) repeats
MRLTLASARCAIAGCLFVLTLAASASAATRPQSVLELAAQQKDLSTFVAAVHTAGLDGTLSAAGPMTVFAPTNDAFAKMPDADRAALLASPDRLKALILGLTIDDLILMNDGDESVANGAIASAAGPNVTFALDGGGGQTVDGVHVVRTDLRAANGSITTLAAVPLS